MRDFTLKKYESLLQAIKSTDYTVSTVLDFLKSCPKNASFSDTMLTAQLTGIWRWQNSSTGTESSPPIISGMWKRLLNPMIILQIAKMGHEIGFHYEVMDKANGNPEKAIEIFKQELEDLRKSYRKRNRDPHRMHARKPSQTLVKPGPLEEVRFQGLRNCRRALLFNRL